MTAAKLHRVKEAGGGWEGACPLCQAIINLPLIMNNADCFTCEIVCSNANCRHRFSVKESGGDMEISLLSVHELEMSVAKVAERLRDTTLEIDSQLSTSKQKLEKLRSRLSEADKLGWNAAEKLSKLSLDAEKQCDSIRDEVTAANNASSAAMEVVIDSINKMSSSIEITHNQFVKAKERIGSINPELAGLKKNFEFINRQLANWTQIIKANTQSSLYPPIPHVRGAPESLPQFPAFSPPQPPSGNGSARPDDATNRFRELLQSPETIKQLVAAFPNGFSVNLERNRAYESLPHLFDLVEQELYSWSQPERMVESEAARQAVVEVLQRMRAVMATWQEVNGLERYGAPGDSYDYALHDMYLTRETDDAEKFETIKDIVYSGYRLRYDRSLLRRARVVIWVPAMNRAPSP